ncbi:hypothetical protein SAMN02745127_01492 [Oceanospirillum multiglobuliferum]|uniref:Imelysin-like domain-containing protein n=1 Tax=Oceanospirillum multiglobuliferum TaxID=64969 RepID=A0A1T4PIP4_9GAMM|nr:imelysin family protein [Oceanospirillum multiglobuliferum]OPX55552.1 hypothetical protein BTE48_07980 [Oceanospirillum multiglobuliferum]SJZ90718.1 hypothetical protein SAMN02745127_01492 [Oceanospirillum multiglobuliferum]
MLFSRHALCSGIAVALISSSSFAFDYDEMIAEGVHYPEQLMRQLIQTNRQFGSQVRMACSTRAAPTVMAQWSFLPELQQKWLNSVHIWQQLEVYPLGPNTDASVRLNITFWPDRKNLVEKKLKGLLAQGQQPELDKGGVAVQGFAASEYLLFDPVLLQQKRNTEICPSLIAISEKSLLNSQDLLSRWQESVFLSDWHDAALGNESFASAKQAAGYLLEGLAQSAETIAKDKLTKPFRLDKKGGQTNRYLAENWRSGQSLSNLNLNINSLGQIYFGSKPQQASLHQLLIHLGYADEATQIEQAFNQLKQQGLKLEQLGEHAFIDEQGREQAEQLQQHLVEFEKALKQTLPHFGLAQRFNSKDGD